MANFCGNCGNKVNENENFCSRCGVSLNNSSNNYNNYSNQTSIVNDDGGFGWAVLGYFIPLVGLILYFAWKNEKPKTAKALGKGALISVVVSFVLTVIFILFIFRISSNYEYNGGYNKDFPIYDEYMYDFE